MCWCHDVEAFSPHQTHHHPHPHPTPTPHPHPHYHPHPHMVLRLRLYIKVTKTKFCVMLSFCHVSFEKLHSRHYCVSLDLQYHYPAVCHLGNYFHDTAVFDWLLCFRPMVNRMISTLVQRALLPIKRQPLNLHMHVLNLMYHILAVVNDVHVILCCRWCTAKLWTPLYFSHTTWGHHTS